MNGKDKFLPSRTRIPIMRNMESSNRDSDLLSLNRQDRQQIKRNLPYHEQQSNFRKQASKQNESGIFTKVKDQVKGIVSNVLGFFSQEQEEDDFIIDEHHSDLENIQPLQLNKYEDHEINSQINDKILQRQSSTPGKSPNNLLLQKLDESSSQFN